MFTAAFFMTKTWKAGRYPSVSEEISKMGHIQIMEYHSAPKINELSRHRKTRRNLKCALLNKRSQFEKATHCMIPTIQHSRKVKTIERVKRSMMARDWGWWWQG